MAKKLVAKKRPNYKGRGWDEFEMYEALTGKRFPKKPSVDLNDMKGWSKRDEEFHEGLRAEMREVFKAGMTYAPRDDERKHTAKVVRDHCRAMHKLGKKFCPYSDVWKAIANIDKTCDESVLVIADKLLEMMWT